MRPVETLKNTGHELRHQLAELKKDVRITTAIALDNAVQLIPHIDGKHGRNSAVVAAIGLLNGFLVATSPVTPAYGQEGPLPQPTPIEIEIPVAAGGEPPPPLTDVLTEQASDQLWFEQALITPTKQINLDNNSTAHTSTTVPGSQRNIAGDMRIDVSMQIQTKENTPANASSGLKIRVGSAGGPARVLYIVNQSGSWKLLNNARDTFLAADSKILKPATETEEISLTINQDGQTGTITMSGEATDFELSESLYTDSREMTLQIQAGPLSTVTVPSVVLAQPATPEVVSPATVGGSETQPPAPQPTPEPATTGPKEFGKIETRNTAIHFMGEKVQVDLSDPTLFDELYSSLLVDNHNPNGLEIFLYNDKLSPNSIDWTDASHTIVASSVKPRLQDINHYVFSLSMYKGSFLEDTSVLVGTRSNDGVTEVHMGLFPKQGANPSPMDIRELSFNFNSKLIQYLRLQFGIEDNSEESRNLTSKLIERRVRQIALPMPLALVPKITS